MTLLTGTLQAKGRRTVAAALRHTGNDMEGNWSNFHHVLNRARWSPLREADPGDLHWNSIVVSLWL